jgi:hypothetical protein
LANSKHYPGNYVEVLRKTKARIVMKDTRAQIPNGIYSTEATSFAAGDNLLDRQKNIHVNMTLKESNQ